MLSLRPNLVRCGRGLRGFSSSAVQLKKARRMPLKRLIVPVEKRVEQMIQEKGLMRQKIRDQKAREEMQRQRELKKAQEPKTNKDKFQLPVLENFTKDDLHDGENLVKKITDFSELRLLPEVRDAIVEQISKETVLRAENYENKRQDVEELVPKPTPIQTIAIHRMGRHLMEKNLRTYTLAAETGSGKTWAYLSPLADFLKRQELEEGFDNIKDKALIRSVVLLPTHELVDQVYQSIQGLESSLGLHCFKWGHREAHTELLDAFKNRIDILITTPGKIATVDHIRAISRPEHLFAHVRFLVVDEADTLLDRSFVELTHASIRKMPRINRLVLCSATVSSQYNSALQKLFPSNPPQLLVSPRTHAPPKSVKFTLIDSELSPYQGSKLKALAQALYAIHKDGTERAYEKRCVVFVNSKPDAQVVAQKLSQAYGHDAVSLTGDDSPAERADKISAFVTPPKPLTEFLKSEVKKDEYKVPGSNIVLNRAAAEGSGDQEKRMKVLVTTDLAARGINFFAVRNVVLYDSPNTSVDLLHRIGRTGRMGQSGRVIVIMDKKTKPWVKTLVKKRSRS
ncbi:ATP-dependent RNA helicase MRH4, mitochondrial [Cyberlindnera fabianii]|uniref:RNA helicase n=1 Tax=Cyberlindnera fabianii TaxID=36022 RepID=A0A1V2L7T0_CYBFA|nr:ATP-dependent RNA helicase MRH4, mitochondrial [Cyberlindnera fabianii]